MKSKLSRIAAFVMCLLLTLSVAAFALAATTGDAAAAAGARPRHGARSLGGETSGGRNVSHRVSST